VREWKGRGGKGRRVSHCFVVVPFIMIHAFVVVVVTTFAMNVLKL